MTTIAALLASRKFWVGTLTVLAIIVAAVFVALGKIPETSFIATISSITAVGLGVIGSIAWEDSAAKASTGMSGNLAVKPAAFVVTPLHTVDPPKTA